MGFCEAMRTYPTEDQMADYLEKYAQRFGLPVRLAIAVLGLTRNARDQFLVECADCRIEAVQVIVATAPTQRNESRASSPSRPTDHPTARRRVSKSQPITGRRGARGWSRQLGL